MAEVLDLVQVAEGVLDGFFEYGLEPGGKQRPEFCWFVRMEEWETRHT
jgi:hypothetical protein